MKLMPYGSAGGKLAVWPDDGGVTWTAGTIVGAGGAT